MKIAVCGIMPKGNNTCVSLDFGTDIGDVSIYVIICKCLDDNWYAALHDCSSWNHPVIGKVKLEEKDGTINGNVEVEHYCGTFNVRIDVIPEHDGWSVSVTN